MKKIFIVMMAFMFVIVSSGCGLKSKLKGYWRMEGEDILIEFDGDDVVYYSYGEMRYGEYKVKDDKIIMTFSEDNNETTFNLIDVEIKGDEMHCYILEEKEEVIFTQISEEEYKDITLTQISENIYNSIN